MLVLSRRPSEKILFPGVGITVQIVQTKGNTVRVGIEAPEDVRILRAELQPQDTDDALMRMNRAAITEHTRFDQFDDHQLSDMQKRMDEIGLALALAQNQQRQGLSDNVDIALEEAIERLNQLKQRLEPANHATSTVCEPKTKYATSRIETRLEFLEGSDRNFRFEFEFAV